MSITVKNVACAGCGCICEDLSVRIQNGVIADVDGACQVCTQLLFGQTAGESYSPTLTSAVEILAQSRAPFIYGLAGSTVEAQRAAVALAETLGGTVDLALSQFHRDAFRAMQSVGISTSTLGEVRQRADVVVFWGADPANTHPSLLERFINPQGQFVGGNRHVTSVSNTSPNYPIDESIRVAPSEYLTFLAALRSAVNDKDVPIVDSFSQQLGPLAKRLQEASYSVFFFDSELGGFAEIESLYCLVRQLNAHSRCVVIPLGQTQCDNVLTWQTGYPTGVNFSLGYPRYDPQRYSATSLLERGEVDSIVLIGAEGISELSPAAGTFLANLPIIYIGFPQSRLPFNPRVELIVARPGVHCEGSIFRMDGVPIKLRSVFDSPLPTTESILTAIQQGVCASCV
jgi:formylmethanofuran dehydrogenase subunit B